MERFVVATSLAVAVGLPVAAQAGGSGGDRQAAGGGFMSPSVSDPYHDPRSIDSQRRGTGQILGQSMTSENAGARTPQRDPIAPRWANGTLPPRGR
ncbi:hypothetical protein [Methylobacterium soli]|uniref:Uncharacterized protein n=1 Tax=Methylobacterium soli TaxID=553447 RepID=A0A6L3ST43_9HYPH|nr:hypothetical protein [Methylobacterium soli]KAB1076612.1 hypothetical protein F6X53_22185 [Methylobacterium soli]GJE45104.1 hypothetical protein AEGHOMDF_4298 [Methylobacterium soli]